MTNAELKADLAKLSACREAVVWLGERDLATAWAECERADFMLWYAAKRCDRKAVVLAACACARTALKYIPEGEERPRLAIETAEAWTRGEATIEQVRAAADAAYAYAYDAAAAAYAYASAAAASAAADDRAYGDAARDAAAAAAYADAAAAYAAYASYAADNRDKALAEMADIVRGIITVEMLEAK